MGRNFSLKEIITTAIISFLISGIGGTFLGAFVNQYLARAQPTAFIQSVGFSVSYRDLVTIPQSLLEAGQNSLFIKRYIGSVSAKELEQDLSTYEKKKEELAALLQRYEQWESNFHFSANKKDTFSKEDIESLPFLSDSDGRDFLAKRIPLLPDMNEQKCSKASWISFTQPKSTFTLALIEAAIGDKVYSIQSDKPPSNREVHKWQETSLVLSCGKRKPLVDALASIKAALEGEYKTLDMTITTIESLVKDKARLKVEVAVYNKGDTPVFISPFADFYIPNTDLTFKMRIQPDTTNNDCASVVDKMSNVMNKYIEDIHGKRKEETHGFIPTHTLLPSGEVFKIGSVPGKGVRLLYLESKEPMGKDSFERMEHLFESGADKAGVLLSLDGGSSLKSTPTIFGNTHVEKK